MAVGLLVPGRSSATFWLFRTASTVSTPTTNTVLSLVVASPFGWEPVEKTDALRTLSAHVLVFLLFFFSHQKVKKAEVRT